MASPQRAALVVTMVAFVMSFMELAVVSAQAAGAGAGQVAAQAAAGSESVGMVYGRNAERLPPTEQVVKLLQSRGVKHVRIYEVDPAFLTALGGSGIDVGLVIGNSLIKWLAASTENADQWVTDKMVPYGSTTFATITVGDQVLTYRGDPTNIRLSLLAAMQNVWQALQKRPQYASGSVKVSTSFSMHQGTAHTPLFVSPSFPPSAGRFLPGELSTLLWPILKFLTETKSVFMISLYPFYSYQDDHRGISLDYAVGNPGAIPVQDSRTGLAYPSMFDAQLDTVRYALIREGFSNLPIMVTATGWPSGPAGTFAATVENARSYNGNVVKHVLGSPGTPLRPSNTSGPIPTFLFALFNEDENPENSTDRYFGLYDASNLTSPVYDISLTL